MPLRYYGVNATQSTISTVLSSQLTTIKDEAKKTMTKDKNDQATEQLNDNLENNNTSSPQENKRAKSPISKLSLVAIAITLCFGGFLYYHGHQQAELQKQTIASLQAEIANLKQSTKQVILDDLQRSITNAVNQQNQQFSSLEERVNKKITDLESSQLQTTNQMNDAVKISEQSIHKLNERLSAMSTTDDSMWLISEANYLVHLAGRKIWNDQDYATARLLLKSADESLAQTNDPSLLPARQAINQDITSLAKVSFIDADGIIMNLMGLSDALAELPLVGNYKEIDLGMTQYQESEPELVTTDTNSQNTIKTEPNSEITSSPSDWSDNLIKSSQSFLGKFITITKIEKNDGFSECIAQAGQDEKQLVKCQILRTPISLEESLYLRENIRFRLLIAAQAVPRHQELIYQRALNDVEIWVNAYFDGDASSVKAFLNDITNLQHQSISNQYAPEKLASSMELEKLMQTRVRAALAK